MNVIERIGGIGIVPVVVVEAATQALPTAKALRSGGVDVMEITMRTSAGLDAIKEVAANCPEMLVGAGTVITLEQCQACVNAGAKFIVSPGFDEKLVSWCIDNGVACVPGCVTPTEIITALSHGLKVLKFFPANMYGGVAALKALSAPFQSIKFIPTGGINLDNLYQYAQSKTVHAVGGSWLCSKADIACGDFEKLTRLAAESVKLVTQARSSQR